MSDSDIYFVEEYNYSKSIKFRVIDSSSYDEPVEYFKTKEDADRFAYDLNLKHKSAYYEDD